MQKIKFEIRKEKISEKDYNNNIISNLNLNEKINLDNSNFDSKLFVINNSIYKIVKKKDKNNVERKFLTCAINYILNNLNSLITVFNMENQNYFIRSFKLLSKKFRENPSKKNFLKYYLFKEITIYLIEEKINEINSENNLSINDWNKAVLDSILNCPFDNIEINKIKNLLNKTLFMHFQMYYNSKNFIYDKEENVEFFSEKFDEKENNEYKIAYSEYYEQKAKIFFN